MTNVQSTPANSSTSLPGTQVNVNQLGYFLDGWADLIEGMGEKAKEVRDAVVNGLKEREMPDVYTNEITGIVGLTGGERRAYTINQTAPGASTTIYIGKHGKDLYVAWRTFIKPVPNWVVIWSIVGISALLGFLSGGRSSSIYGGSSFSFTGFLISTLILLIIGAGAVAIAGRIMRGSYLAFFFIEPNIFDAEDITAMGLSAHKTLLRSLDSSGIDVSKLRLKQKFQGGRRGEEL
jgi:hypothetical protein